MTYGKPLLLGAAKGDDPINYSMLEMRGLIDALVANEGVCGPDHLLITSRAAGANLSIDASDGWAIIKDDGAVQSKFACPHPAADNIPAPASPASGTRHHLVYARVRNRQADGGDFSDWFIDFKPDTGSGLPNVAAIPSAIALAEVRISAGQQSITAANITDLRPYARAIGADRRGPVTVKTDISGFATILHGLGRKPTAGHATINKPTTGAGNEIPTSCMVAIDGTETATTVRVRAFTSVPYYVYSQRTFTISVTLW